MNTAQIEQLHSRRGFLKASACVSAVGISTNAALATELLTITASDTDSVCYALGFALGQQLVKTLDTSALPLQLHYGDSAGANVDSLRLGLVDGVGEQSGQRPVWTESQVYKSAVLGTISLLNPTSGAMVHIEIPTVALSHLELNRSTQDAIDFITTKLI
jgi:hypothetical protein